MKRTPTARRSISGAAAPHLFRTRCRSFWPKRGWTAFPILPISPLRPAWSSPATRCSSSSPAATRPCRFITTFSKRKALMTTIPARCSTPPPSVAPSRCAATKATYAPTSSRCFPVWTASRASPRASHSRTRLFSPRRACTRSFPAHTFSHQKPALLLFSTEQGRFFFQFITVEP